MGVLSEYAWHLVALAALLAASAFFSGSETALFNLTREQLRRFRASRRPWRRLAARLMDDPRRLLVTILFGNNLANTAFFVVSVFMIHNVHEHHPAAAAQWGVALALAAPVTVILFGEVLPKSVGAVIPEWVAPLVSTPLVLLEYAVTPVRVVLVTALVTPLERLIVGRRPRDTSLLTVEELEAILESAAREGAVSPDEGDMLADVLALGTLRVRDVMTPRVDIAGCDVNTPTRVAGLIFRRSRHTKMLVYEREMDNVLGAVYAKTVLLSPDQPLADLVRPVYYVPESKTVESLLKDFRRQRIQFAVVVDEFGGLAGLVTLEDCLEEIVGEIEDETDRPAPPPVVAVGESEYLLAGTLSIRSWGDRFDTVLPATGGRYSTVGGFITSLLGRMPRAGDTVRWRNLEFIVEEVRHRRLTRVRLKLTKNAEATA